MDHVREDLRTDYVDEVKQLEREISALNKELSVIKLQAQDQAAEISRLNNLVQRAQKHEDTLLESIKNLSLGMCK